jgi:hypothetical protein
MKGSEIWFYCFLKVVLLLGVREKAGLDCGHSIVGQVDNGKGDLWEESRMRSIFIWAHHLIIHICAGSCTMTSSHFSPPKPPCTLFVLLVPFVLSFRVIYQRRSWPTVKGPALNPGRREAYLYFTLDAIWVNILMTEERLFLYCGLQVEN